MGGCQNYGRFLDPYYDAVPDIQGTPKRIIILTATHIKALGRLQYGLSSAVVMGLWGGFGGFRGLSRVWGPYN